MNTDNSTSDRYTIIDVFALDRSGLLYAVTRTLFELDLSVWRAKIGTYLDQVVDVFYVTDQQGRKMQDEARTWRAVRRPPAGGHRAWRNRQPQKRKRRDDHRVRDLAATDHGRNVHQRPLQHLDGLEPVGL